MKKYILASILILAMAVPVFGQVTLSGPAIGAQGNQGSLSIRNTELETAPFAMQGQTVTNTFNPSNTFTPTNINQVGNGFGNFSPTSVSSVRNDVDIRQQQFGYVAPEQTTIVSFKSPVQLAPVSTPGLPDLAFGNGRAKDVTKIFALFNTKVKMFDPSKYRLDGQVDECANEPIKRFIGKASDLLKQYDAIPNVAYLIFQSEANKTLQGGANLNGMGTGVGASGASAAGGGGGGLLGIQGGITKAHDLYTILIVKVVPI